MITHVRIQNFRSFLDASVDLQPFSLVVGANGSGKTNFLRFFRAISEANSGSRISSDKWIEHVNSPKIEQGCSLVVDGKEIKSQTDIIDGVILVPRPPWARTYCKSLGRQKRR